MKKTEDKKNYELVKSYEEKISNLLPEKENDDDYFAMCSAIKIACRIGFTCDKSKEMLKMMIDSYYELLERMAKQDQS